MKETVVRLLLSGVCMTCLFAGAASGQDCAFATHQNVQCMGGGGCINIVGINICSGYGSYEECVDNYSKVPCCSSQLDSAANDGPCEPLAGLGGKGRPCSTSSAQPLVQSKTPASLTVLAAKQAILSVGSPASAGPAVGAAGPMGGPAASSSPEVVAVAPGVKPAAPTGLPTKAEASADKQAVPSPSTGSTGGK